MGAPTQVVLSWSGGKDCAWALAQLRARPDVEVVGLLATSDEETGRISMHGVRRDLARAQAEAVGLPLEEVALPPFCSNAVYEARMGRAVQAARARGVRAFAFGDLFLEDVRRYREQRMEAAGMRCLFPLWGRDSWELAREMTAAGVRAVIVCVDPAQLDPSFAGRIWDAELLDALPPGVDPCGERGELHTFVFEGPMLRAPLPVRVGQVSERGGFVYADVLPARPDATGSEAP